MEVVALEVLQQEINQTLSQVNDLKMCSVTLSATGTAWGLSDVCIKDNGGSYSLLDIAVYQYVQKKFGNRKIEEVELV